MKSSSNPVINGNSFWADDVLEGLNRVPLKHNCYELYADAPPSLYASLSEVQKKYPDKCCIVDDSGISYTYTAFLELVEDFSKVLFHSYRVRAGTRVGLLLHNSIEFCVSFYAVNRLNAVTVPLSTKYKKNAIFSLIEKSALDGIICEKDYSEWFETDRSLSLGFAITVPPDIAHYALPSGKDFPPAPIIQTDWEDTAIIMFTSGTTSQSKGVLLTHYNTMHAISVYKRIFSIMPDDRTIIPVPIYHVTGLLALLGLFVASGGCIYLHRAFHARRILSDIGYHHITFLHGAPTVFSLLLEHKKEYPNLPTLRMMACGSSNMPASKILELKDWIGNAEFRTIYGLTETSSPAAILPEDAAASRYIGSCGHPVPGTQFKICDENSHVLPLGQIGSVFVKGSVVTPAYVTDKITAIENGWLDTGDLGYFDESGCLYIVDRKKDMINRGGEKICSIDVENALYTIPGIIHAAVVGISDNTYGEVPAAMVTLEKGSSLSSNEIQALLKTKLAKYQIPVKFLITDSIPLTLNSKVDKKRIRQLLSQNS